MPACQWTVTVEHVVDTTRYPLAETAGPAHRRLLTRVADDLAATGCCVLPGFVRPALREVMRGQGAAVAPLAYSHVETVNAYNTAPDPGLPVDHPARTTMRRGNTFVARDRIPADSLIQRLYTSELFQRFVARCFGRERVHELADPLSGLTLNVVRPGREHPWHFDTNEFTVTLLTREADAGGVFEYCPNLRAPGAENLAAVRDVLAGRGGRLVRRLALRPGDLQLFAGRYALHRVTRVAGRTARHSAIFAYCDRPGVVGTVERTRQLFGRVTPVHRAAELRAPRADDLII